MKRGCAGSSPSASRISLTRFVRFFSTTKVPGQSRSCSSVFESALAWLLDEDARAAETPSATARPACPRASARARRDRARSRRTSSAPSAAILAGASARPAGRAQILPNPCRFPAARMRLRASRRLRCPGRRDCTCTPRPAGGTAMRSRLAGKRTSGPSGPGRLSVVALAWFGFVCRTRASAAIRRTRAWPTRRPW